MAPPWKIIDEGDQPMVLSRKLGKDGQGTIGNKIELRINFFRVSFELPEATLYHFDVKIDDSFDRMSAAPTKIGFVGAAPAPQKKKATKKKKRLGRNKGKNNTEVDEERGESADSSWAFDPLKSSQIQKYGTERRGFKSRIPKPKQKRIFEAFCRQHPNLFLDKNSEPCFMAYDGEANGVSSLKPSQFKKKIPISYDFVFQDDLDQHTKTYRITFELVNQGKLKTLLENMKKTTHVSTLPTALFQMLEIIFNYEKTLVFQSVVRNQFFSQDKEMFDKNFGLGSTKEGVTGFSCSLRPVQGFDGWKEPGKFMLNVDVAHAAFYCRQPLLEFLRRRYVQIDTKERLSQETIKSIEQEIVKNNIKVVTTHTPIPFRYVVRGVSKYTPLEKDIVLADERKVTIAEYMMEKYNYKVKYPKMQCLIVGNKDSLIPIEVCEIAPDQRVKGKLSDEEIKQFVAQAVVSPDARHRQIQDIIVKNKFKDDPYLKQLGAVISEDFEKVDGRVLPPPVVRMAGKSADVYPKGGVWDVRQNQFLIPARLDQWAVINFTGTECGVDKFIDSIIRLAGDRGMKTARPLKVIRDAKLDHAADTLRKVKKDHPTVKFILCVKYNETKFYNIIKYTAERELDVATSCVLFKNVRGGSDAVVGNLLLKVNVQLGGVNHSSSYPRQIIFAEIFSEAIMVMGADANHPPAGVGVIPSVAAVVGSTDKDATQYAVEVRAQQHRRDMIADIKEMTKNLLRQYLRSRNLKPKRIVMFRDGVSESEFVKVLRLEMMAMREACTEVQNDGLYKPAITFICVQKRHSTRMFCENPSNADRSGNVPAGTVLDTVVIQSFVDFYLCSHRGIKGTSKPAHYIVLWDDSDFSMDQLQLLTNSLCYNYSRCSRSVSIPAPVYYAHLAASRGKVHLAASQATNPDGCLLSIARGEDGFYSDEELARAVKVDIDSDLSRQPYYT